MIFSDTRHKVALFSLLFLLLVAIILWFVWANAVDRIPKGGTLVMQTDSSHEHNRLVHPYYSIASRRVMV